MLPYRLYELYDQEFEALVTQICMEVLGTGLIVFTTGIQCIISVIDADLPRDESDQKVPFTSSEIILDLHDGGPTGRLFRTKEF